MKLTKRRFLLSFLATVMLLAVVRAAFPSVAEPRKAWASEGDAEIGTNADSNVGHNETRVLKRHRLRSVTNFHRAFPDTNAVHLSAALHWGVEPVKDRADAERHKHSLTYIGENPYYHVAPLGASIPYLVPHAALLLQDMGEAFYDSLHAKGIPLQQLVVTSALRTEADVTRLRRHNVNATENSCHLYGTTFDVSYNRYRAVANADGSAGRAVRSDTLKWVLAEVLNDMRLLNRCYVKYEVKQGCFHITVR